VQIQITSAESVLFPLLSFFTLGEYNLIKSNPYDIDNINISNNGTWAFMYRKDALKDS